jgi:hypothetical protein
MRRSLRTARFYCEKNSASWFVPEDSIALKAGPYELLSWESNVRKVKHHNPNYENDESDEQKILAMVGTFPL